MDGNKDDALKCLRIGKEALQSGDRIRALKFFAKARRLDPSLPVDDLSSEQDGLNGGGGGGGGDPKGLSGSSLLKRSDKRRRGTSPPAASSSSSVGYTEEQIAIVREIRKKKDYYEIMGVEKTCSVEDVRKAYRKLSLKVHPDKNQAPGAEEAFKSLSKAFQCLSDEENRRRYDLVGSDEPQYQRVGPRRRAQGFNGFHEAEFDPDEIFRAFFGGMAPGTTQFGGFSFGPGMGPRMNAQMGPRMNPQWSAGGGGGGSHFRVLIQLLPVLLILLFNFMPSSEPIYSLSRSYPYEYQFSTQKGVNYYVASTKFEQDYPSNSARRVTLEDRVERDYFSILAQNCRREMQRRQWGYIHETPHCDMLRKFDTAAR